MFTAVGLCVPVQFNEGKVLLSSAFVARVREQPQSATPPAAIWVAWSGELWTLLALACIRAGLGDIEVTPGAFHFIALRGVTAKVKQLQFE